MNGLARAAALGAVAIALSSAPQPARAGVIASVGVHGLATLGDASDLGSWGAATDLRLGWEFSFDPLRIVVEGVGTWAWLDAQGPGSADYHVLRGLAGVRLGLAWDVELWIGFHFGGGEARADGDDFVVRHPGWALSAMGAMGGRVAEHVRLSIETSYQLLRYDGGGGFDYEWVQLGARADFTF